VHFVSYFPHHHFESLMLVINFCILFFSWKIPFWEMHWWNVVSCTKAETLRRFEFMRFVSDMNILKMLLWADIFFFFFAYFASSEFIDGLFVLYPASSIVSRTLHFVKWICLSPHWPKLTVCNRSNEQGPLHSLTLKIVFCLQHHVMESQKSQKYKV
jgi:hypothetical protein